MIAKIHPSARKPAIAREEGQPRPPGDGDQEEDQPDRPDQIHAEQRDEHRQETAELRSGVEGVNRRIEGDVSTESDVATKRESHEAPCRIEGEEKRGT